MALRRHPGAPGPTKWSLYRTPRPPSDRRRRRPYLLAAIVVTVAIAVIVAVVLRGGSPSTPGGAALSPLLGRYTALSDATLRSCPPDRSQLDAFDRCLARYSEGLSGLALPPSDAAALTDVQKIIELLRT